MMKIIKIGKNDWQQGIETLKDAYRLFGPVKQKGGFEFEALGRDGLPDFRFQNTRLSPKSIIHPQSDVMFEYSLDPIAKDHDILKEVPKDTTPKAMVGIRPCDAYSFLLVGKNFNTPEYKDPYWLASYESTTMIGLACRKPCPTCFCTSAGAGPFNEDGLDVLLVEDENAYLAKVLTPKGEAIVGAAGWDIEVTAADKFQTLKQEAESKISRSVHTDRLKHIDMTTLFDAPFWEEVAFACINCGTCTYSCPTCWCFDIQDEVHGKCGVRMRNWDSCMYPLFTHHGSGHNPRSDKVQRVRQRFMHKLKYYVDKFDSGVQCVGCGRCIRLCPVNIDIRDVCDLMNNFEN